MRFLKIFINAIITYVVIRVVLAALFGGTIAEQIGVTLANIFFPIMILLMIVRAALCGYMYYGIGWGIAKVVGIGALFLIAAGIIYVFKSLFV